MRPCKVQIHVNLFLSKDSAALLASAAARPRDEPLTGTLTKETSPYLYCVSANAGDEPHLQKWSFHQSIRPEGSAIAAQPPSRAEPKQDSRRRAAQAVPGTRPPRSLRPEPPRDLAHENADDLLWLACCSRSERLWSMHFACVWTYIGIYIYLYTYTHKRT